MPIPFELRHPRARPKLGADITLLALIVVGGLVVYAAIDTALVFLRPSLSLLHNAESDYGSRGDWGWLMNLNFLLRGALSLAAVRALKLGTDTRLRTGRALLTAWAIASALLAFFPDDPAGTPAHWTGRVHLVLAFVAFIAVLVGTLLTTSALRRRPGWSAVAIPMAILARGAVVPLVLLSRTGFHAHSLGGLYEKLFLALELLWLALVTVWAARITS